MIWFGESFGPLTIVGTLLLVASAVPEVAAQPSKRAQLAVVLPGHPPALPKHRAEKHGADLQLLRETSRPPGQRRAPRSVRGHPGPSPVGTGLKRESRIQRLERDVQLDLDVDRVLRTGSAEDPSPSTASAPVPTRLKKKDTPSRARKRDTRRDFEVDRALIRPGSTRARSLTPAPGKVIDDEVLPSERIGLDQKSRASVDRDLPQRLRPSRAIGSTNEIGRATRAAALPTKFGSGRGKQEASSTWRKRDIRRDAEFDQSNVHPESSQDPNWLPRRGGDRDEGDLPSARIGKDIKSRRSADYDGKLTKPGTEPEAAASTARDPRIKERAGPRLSAQNARDYRVKRDVDRPVPARFGLSVRGAIVRLEQAPAETATVVLAASPRSFTLSRRELLLGPMLAEIPIAVSGSGTAEVTLPGELVPDGVILWAQGVVRSCRSRPDCILATPIVPLAPRKN